MCSGNDVFLAFTEWLVILLKPRGAVMAFSPATDPLKWLKVWDISHT